MMMESVDILICDDCAEDADVLATLVMERAAHLGTAARVERCADAAHAMELAKQGGFDALFFDVYLGGPDDVTGIEAARQLRSNGFEGAIVFSTVSQTHALEAFGVNAVQYLVKPVTADAVENALAQVIRQSHTDKMPSLLLAAGKQLVRVPLSSLVYSETRQHYQHITTTEGALERVRMSGSELFGKLSGKPEFVRVGASFIVNLQHVVCMGPKVIELAGGHRIPVSRGAYPQVKKKYFAYYLDPGN